ncbi:SCAN domain-containing protein 3, partial [Trichinella spiralis]
LPEMSKGKDVFNVLSLHLETKDLSWKNCVGICTDGALSMVGSTRGFVSLVKQENPDIVSTHYFLHREVLISKSLEGKLKKVFDDVIKMISFIKQSLFTPKCSKSHVKAWIKNTNSVAKQRKSSKQGICFEQNDKPNFSKCFEHKEWLQSLAYLADIFGHMNLLNKKLQGSNENILTSSDKILRFKKG